MKSYFQIPIVLAATMYAACLPAQTAASHQPASSKAAMNAQWAREFAAPFDPSKAGDVGRENNLNWDPRFKALLKAAFHQGQWFWFDHHRFTPVSELVQMFIGVPGSVILDGDRYVTVDGCLPHACFDRGLLWIDTVSRPAMLIFAAVDPVGGDANFSHLWLFGSEELNWQHFPAPFLDSLHRWIATIGARGYNGTSGYRYALVTMVQPNGEQVDLSPATLQLASAASEIKENAQ